MVHLTEKKRKISHCILLNVCNYTRRQFEFELSYFIKNSKISQIIFLYYSIPVASLISAQDIFSIGQPIIFNKTIKSLLFKSKKYDSTKNVSVFCNFYSIPVVSLISAQDIFSIGQPIIFNKTIKSLYAL